MKMLRVRRHGWPVGRALSRFVATASVHEKRVYVIAGEPSGDAIGAKVIAALRRKETAENGDTSVVFRGVGGTRMTKEGGFVSLFPMEELSVMGLVEVVPYLWRFRRRIAETVEDIRAFKPDVVLTIDSKGFTFRVQNALQADAELSASPKRMHYVAPSVWAYKHRQANRNLDGLATLLHKMFVILPFEEAIFMGNTTPNSSRWCQFVGHPAVEDFLAFHGAYEGVEFHGEVDANTAASLDVSAGGLLEMMELDATLLRRHGAMFQRFLSSHETDPREERRRLGIPTDTFVVCALVGSRENEVRRTIRTVLEAVDALQRPSERLIKTSIGLPMKLSPLTSASCVVKRPVHVFFPTIRAVRSIVQQEIDNFCCDSGASSENFQVIVDVDFSDRITLFRSVDAAVAVSGTIVMETTLANLPTVVIYRANRLTEVLAKRLSAVGFVSIPNLLLGRAEIPELLFRDCTASNITQALKSIYMAPHSHSKESRSPSQLAMALSTLTPWTTKSGTKETLVPIRGSDLVADAIWEALHAKS